VHMVDALAITGDEGRSSLRKAAGSWQTSFDPQISEWGNPLQQCSIPSWIHRLVEANRVNWNISVARGKEINRDSESSGERNSALIVGFRPDSYICSLTIWKKHNVKCSSSNRRKPDEDGYGLWLHDFVPKSQARCARKCVLRKALIERHKREMSTSVL